jgi:hypothetical protein
MALSSFVASLILLSSLSLAQKDNGEECSCFRTNGSSAAYFTNHQFFDYRNISSSAPVPPLIASDVETANANATSSYFSTDAFTQDWIIQKWNNSDQIGTANSDATTLMINSFNNIYIGTFALPLACNR